MATMELPKNLQDSVKAILACRKSPHQARVLAMMQRIRELSDLPKLPSSPCVPSASIILKQAKLIFEEVMELFEACGVGVRLKENLTDWRSYTYADFKLTTENLPDESTLPHIAKELTDVNVVTTGMFLEFGISDMSVQEETDQNNLKKFGEGGYLDENKKWRKPPNHPSPDIETCLTNQGWAKPEVSNEESQEHAVSIQS